MPIFLIGFMCSGKSLIGRDLAQAMGYRHYDLDRLIEQRVGPITPWFQKNGDAAFREVERKVLMELLNTDKAIISTGGGTPCESDNMDRMLQAGTVVYLDVPLNELVSRAEEKGGDRPLLFGLKGQELRTRIEELLADRSPVYDRAQMRIRANDDAHVIVSRLQQALEYEQR